MLHDVEFAIPTLRPCREHAAAFPSLNLETQIQNLVSNLQTTIPGHFASFMDKISSYKNFSMMQFQNIRLLQKADFVAATEKRPGEHAYCCSNLKPQELILKPYIRPVYIRSRTISITFGRVCKGYVLRNA